MMPPSVYSFFKTSSATGAKREGSAAAEEQVRGWARHKSGKMERRDGFDRRRVYLCDGVSCFGITDHGGTPTTTRGKVKGGNLYLDTLPTVRMGVAPSGSAGAGSRRQCWRLGCVLLFCCRPAFRGVGARARKRNGVATGRATGGPPKTGVHGVPARWRRLLWRCVSAAWACSFGERWANKGGRWWSRHRKLCPTVLPPTPSAIFAVMSSARAGPRRVGGGLMVDWAKPGGTPTAFGTLSKARELPWQNW
ncbi:hypothetical protein B0T14DRAFT_99982 [Immersiella caudata]|uniref:Uncharacterized protein n=1 Tax=Immersiella caudata TaxID=314043 RepID=A0AA39X361_9PEZI|nr:hypothetical protein B0T14DRAFT_99982 [Immersiella caudata]